MDTNKPPQHHVWIDYSRPYDVVSHSCYPSPARFDELDYTLQGIITTVSKHRGDVYIANLVPRSGSKQKGKRPVIIVSHDGFNLTPSWRSIIIVPLSTSAAPSKRGPTAIVLPKGTGGLRNASIALCHQVTTLDRAKLTKRLGSIPKDLLEYVDSGLLAALDLVYFQP